MYKKSVINPLVRTQYQYLHDIKITPNF